MLRMVAATRHPSKETTAVNCPSHLRRFHRAPAPVARRLAVPFMALLLLLGTKLAARSAPTPILGMVADRSTKSVTVFDADTYAVRGAVSLPTTSPVVGDCLISPDQTLGFVTDDAFHLWVIDLAGPVPALAAGINPISIGIHGNDLAL